MRTGQCHSGCMRSCIWSGEDRPAPQSAVIIPLTHTTSTRSRLWGAQSWVGGFYTVRREEPSPTKAADGSASGRDGSRPSGKGGQAVYSTVQHCSAGAGSRWSEGAPGFRFCRGAGGCSLATGGHPRSIRTMIPIETVESIRSRCTAETTRPFWSAEAWPHCSFFIYLLFYGVVNGKKRKRERWNRGRLMKRMKIATGTRPPCTQRRSDLPLGWDKPGIWAASLVQSHVVSPPSQPLIPQDAKSHPAPSSGVATGLLAPNTRSWLVAEERPWLPGSFGAVLNPLAPPVVDRLRDSERICRQEGSQENRPLRRREDEGRGRCARAFIHSWARKSLPLTRCLLSAWGPGP
jgi:hypothetical protein